MPGAQSTVQPSRSVGERPPIVASIEHFHRHPEVTRYGDELSRLIWLWREDLTVQAPTRVPTDREVVLRRG